MFSEILKKFDFDYLFIVFIFINLVYFLLVVGFIYKLGRKKLKLKRYYLIFLVPYLLFHIIFLSSYFSLSPSLFYTSPSYDSVISNYTDPIELKFTHPVYKSELITLINPEIEGEWVWDDYLGLSDITRSGRLILKESFFPDISVVIFIKGVHRVFMQPENHEVSLRIASASSPSLVKTTPLPFSIDNSTDGIIDLLFNKNSDKLVEFNITTNPVFEFEVKKEDTTISIVPKINLVANTNYKISIEKIPIKFSLITNNILEKQPSIETLTLEFATGATSNIKSFSPLGNGILPNSEISINFEKTLLKESVESSIQIYPNIQKQFVWIDEKNLIIKAEAGFDKETIYTLSFKSPVKTFAGDVITISTKFSFETIGKVKVIAINPSNQSSGISEFSPVTVFFDQEVDKESAQNNFVISPQIAGSIDWTDNKTMNWRPSGPFQFSTNYSILLNPGIKSVYGLTSDKEFLFSFTTRAEEIQISNVPFYYQPYGSFSCNIYAAKMALGWKGYYLSAYSIISEIGYNPTIVSDQWTGNPYKEFVGNSDGGWGYGAYAPAIQEVFNNRGIYTEIKQGWSIAGMAEQVAAGRPVIIWRYNGVSSDYSYSWYSSDGTYIPAISGQHGGVVIGFRGSINNPTSLLLYDPWYGPFWINSQTFDYYWSRLGRTGLVIF